MLHNLSGLTGWQELFLNNDNRFKHLFYYGSEILIIWMKILKANEIQLS